VQIIEIGWLQDGPKRMIQVGNDFPVLFRTDTLSRRCYKVILTMTPSFLFVVCLRLFLRIATGSIVLSHAYQETDEIV
jgi:hypothetical protein